MSLLKLCRVKVALVSCFLTALSASPLFAQHDQLGGTPGDGSGCSYCHTSHAASDRYSLIVDGRLEGLMGSLQVEERSASCLRCHLNEAIRQQQGVSGLIGGAFGYDRRYLGTDLGDDHRVGKLSVGEDVGGWGLAGSRLNSAVPFQEGGELACSSCHDPHRSTELVPAPEQEKFLCTSCHEFGAFEATAHGPLVCSDCHQMHGSGSGRLLKDSGRTTLCQSCHGGQQTPGMPTGFRDAPVGHTVAPSGECTDCHAIHE